MLNRTVENLEPYAFEAAYLNQMNNEARFYLNGKGIVRRDDGTLLFFIVEDCDLEYFDFGGTILDRFLTELTYMDSEEIKQLELLRNLDDKLFMQFGLNVVAPVYMQNETQQRILQDVIIIDPDSKAYFRFDLVEIDSISKGTAEEMKTFDECPLSEPYLISIAEDGSVIVKE